MAKRKKAKVRHYRRRSRRVSGIGKIDFTEIGLVVAGAVAAKVLTNKLSTSTNATMAKVAPFAGVALGIGLPFISKSEMIRQISLGLIAGGGVAALGSSGLKIISGFENTVSGIGYPYYQQPQIPFRQVAGVGTTAGAQGLTKGTRSNFSGSRNSQMNTIAGICCDESH